MDAAFGVNAELFIGRVAIHLLASKSFLSDVLGEDHELGKSASLPFLSRLKTLRTSGSITEICSLLL